jgi:hypothetical protein
VTGEKPERFDVEREIIQRALNPDNRTEDLRDAIAAVI